MGASWERENYLALYSLIRCGDNHLMLTLFDLVGLFVDIPTVFHFIRFKSRIYGIASCVHDSLQGIS